MTQLGLHDNLIVLCTNVTISALYGAVIERLEPGVERESSAAEHKLCV